MFRASAPAIRLVDVDGFGVAAALVNQIFVTDHREPFLVGAVDTAYRLSGFATLGNLVKLGLVFLAQLDFSRAAVRSGSSQHQCQWQSKNNLTHCPSPSLPLPVISGLRPHICRSYHKHRGI